MKRIKLLDSLRGASAACVVFHHLYTRFTPLFQQDCPAWLQKIMLFVSELNVLAVMFFFFLSGFSICISLQHGLPVTRAAFNQYIYRRLRRILPVYYVALLFTLLCGIALHIVTANDDFSLKNMAGNLLFLQSSKSYEGNWFAPYGDNGPLWSLSFEMFYYLFLPLFLYLLLKLFKTNQLSQKINMAALIASFFISIVCVVLNKFFFFPFVAFAGLFFVWYTGFFIGWIYVNKSIQRKSNFFLLLVFAIILTAVNKYLTSATAGKLLCGSLIALCFYVLANSDKFLPARLFSALEKSFNFLFYAIGRGSYVLYLFHYPMLMLLKGYFSVTLWQLLLYTAAISALSIWMEQIFTRQKWLFLKLNYLKQPVPTLPQQ